MGKLDNPGPEWVGKATAACMSGVSEKAIDQRHRKLLGADGVRDFGGRVWFHARLLTQLLNREAVEAAAAGTGADPLLSGEASPALEEYRKHRARVAKVEADQRENLAVSVSEVKPVLLALCAVIRQGIERVERSHGGEAVAPIRDGLEQFAAGIEKMFPDVGNGKEPGPRVDAGNTAAPSADDAGVCGTGDSDSQRPV
jgi:hypothetical protein